MTKKMSKKLQLRFSTDPVRDVDSLNTPEAEQLSLFRKLGVSEGELDGRQTVCGYIYVT